MIKIIIVECENTTELVECINQINGKLEKQEKEKTFRVDNYGEIDGKMFEQIMLEKGYKASSHQSKERLCKKFNILRVKSGNQWKYVAETVTRIPVRKFKRRRKISNTKITL